MSAESPAPAATTTAQAAISIRGLTKSYVEGVRVLHGVDLEVRPGEVHALVGGNGSGKSTLVKVLSGYHAADAGSRLSFGGTPVHGLASSDDLEALGVRFVHQESVLVPGMSVLDNLAMGHYRTGFGWRIDRRAEERRLRALFDRWALDVDPRADLATLPLPVVARLAVLRALRRRDGQTLTAVVLDEPTAALGREDAAGVLDWLRELARHERVGVLFISHRLDEIRAVADRVSVLRGGRIVATLPARETDEEVLVEQIVGVKLESYYPPRHATADGAVALRVRGLTAGRVRDVDVRIEAGEVVGVTGIPGSGFDEVPYLLMDPDRRARGECEIAGVPITLARTPIRARGRLGLVLIPADRKRTALATDMTVRENVTLPRLGEFFRGGRLRRRAETARAQSLADEFGVRPNSPQVTAGRLSGGNQQKAVLAKWLSTRPAVLMMHEPTQAVDVGARADIFRLVRACADNGTAVLLASVEYEDLAHLCDRVLVFGGGRIAAELTGAALTPDKVVAAAYLASGRTAA